MKQRANSSPSTLTRRSFVRKTGAVALTAPATFAIVGNAQEPARKLGFALVGLGSLATNQIAPALARGLRHAELRGIVSGSPSKIAEWQKKYSLKPENCYRYENFDDIRNNPDIDIVYIVLPNSMHAEYTIRAAKAGKHVLCEKPMANSTQDARRMIDACKAANRRLAIGYRCQFVPHHLEMIRRSRYEIHGPLKLIEAGFGFRIGDPKQWRLRKEMAGGGALMDVGIYALQGTRYLTGEEPIEVSAVETKTDRVKFAEVDESIFWTLKFPGGVLAQCGTSYNANGMNYLRAYAEKGVFELTSAYGYSGIAGRSPEGPFPFPQMDHFAAEMDDFAECILKNRPSRVPGEEGLADLKVIEGIYQSIREGKSIRLA